MNWKTLGKAIAVVVAICALFAGFFALVVWCPWILLGLLFAMAVFGVYNGMKKAEEFDKSIEERWREKYGDEDFDDEKEFSGEITEKREGYTVVRIDDFPELGNVYFHCPLDGRIGEHIVISFRKED